MALTAAIILVFVFLAGTSIGVVVTLIVMSAWQNRTVASSNEPPTVRDPSNPYEPSKVGLQTVNSRNGCAIALAILGVMGISSLTFVAMFFLSSSRTVKTVPIPPTTTQPVPTLQPPSTPPP